MSTESMSPDSVSTENRPAESSEDRLRARAVTRLKKRRDLSGHLLIYVLVNGFFVVLWTLTSDGGFFWPVIPMAAWGIGVVMNIWDVYRGGEEFDEEQIRREMERLQHR